MSFKELRDRLIEQDQRGWIGYCGTKRQRRTNKFDIENSSGWWTTESDVGRVAHGIPNRVGQLKGYGNAQCPLQVATAWKLLGGD
jgi:DNA (cytosine-5)-methyltransferase 1